MKIRNAEFIISAVSRKQFPEDNLPEIALAGRSNVGKSSLINSLINRKALARTSSQPGKTQTLNFYRINNMFYFVDLPGYGYARVSKKDRAQWGNMIEDYLNIRQNIKQIIQLIDVRHPPTANDIMMYDWLRHKDKPIVIVATKADKISRNDWQKNIKVIKQTLDLRPQDKIVLYSAMTKKGFEEVWEIIHDILGYDEQSETIKGLEDIQPQIQEESAD